MLQRKSDFSSESKPNKSNAGNWSVTKNLGYRSHRGKSTWKGLTSSVNYRFLSSFSGPTQRCCQLILQRPFRFTVNLNAKFLPEFSDCAQLRFRRPEAFLEHSQFDCAEHVNQQFRSSLIESERVCRRGAALLGWWFSLGHRAPVYAGAKRRGAGRHGKQRRPS